MKMLKDQSGKRKRRDKVEQLAVANLMASMDKEQLAIAFMDGMNNSKLMEWATDENGNFPA